MDSSGGRQGDGVGCDGAPTGSAGSPEQEHRDREHWELEMAEPPVGQVQTGPWTEHGLVSVGPRTEQGLVSTGPQTSAGPPTELDMV